MEMKNVLDQLKLIAENNDSEDVARAIETASSYSFKDRLKEAESASIYETPGDDDDQYCAVCGNTGERLDQTGEPCPNCSDEGKKGTYNDEPLSHSDGMYAEHEGEDDGADGGIDAEDAFDRIHDRVEDRGGSDLGQDPWGIGDGDEAQDIGVDGEDDSELEECGDDGSAIDRVVNRSHRSGDGGPVDRIQGRRADRYEALEEELGMVFQTAHERHSWIMNQLNDIANQMDPEDAQMVKSLLKKAGEADVRGGTQ